MVARRKIVQTEKPVRRQGPVGGRLSFDYVQVEELAAVGLSQAQIAESLGCSDRTVSNRLIDDSEFAEAYKRGKHRMRQVLSNNLFTLANRFDRVALIYLSKVHLGWREADEMHNSVHSPRDMAKAIRQEMQLLDNNEDGDDK